MSWMGRACLLLMVVASLGSSACGGGGGKEAPELTAIDPSSGGVAGGTFVTITGVRLTNDDGALPGVRFDGVVADDIAVVDDGTLTCRAPAGTVGTVEVTVSLQHGGATLDGFTYHPAPTITGVAPPRGSIGGGETLTITGTGFLDNEPGAPEVTIGGVLGTSLTVVDDTTLTCVVGAQPGAGAYDIGLTNANGEALLAAAYECVFSPTVTAVAATSGPAGGYTNVTVNGTNFDGGMLAVSFGGQPATQVAVVDPSTLTCRTPPGAAGTVGIEVSTYGGSDTLATAYTYTTWAPDDPLFADQWHLENTAQHANSTSGEDARVVGAWDLGYTGAGVRIGVVDDGLEIAHEDLADNVVSGASWDYGGNDGDPTRNEHGTSVSGVCSGVGANMLGGTGAAPNSTLAGFAVLTSGASDADFADALARGAAATHVYNNSWGSPAYYAGILYGFTEAPYSFHAALDLGVRFGRGGRGSVYIKSAGNSGSPSAGFDGTNGIRGINVIGAVGANGTFSPYSQPGPCLLVCGPSNGDGPGITTTDRSGNAGYSSGNYTSSFGGTSSAGPLVAGVAALVLEARPELRWWEVPLVLALSARRTDTGDAGWVQNGGGHWVHPRYGFGVVDATAAVSLARSWGPRVGLVSAAASKTVAQTVAKGDATGVSSTITIPATTGITNLHTVTLTVFLDHQVCSDLDIVLTSPDGTQIQYIKSVRVPNNTADNALAGIPMVSRHHLGETVAGNWTLKVSDGQNVYDCTWSSWTLTLEGEGTAPPPALVSKPAVGAAARPAAPLVTDADDVVWWDGSRWGRARRDRTLAAEWARDHAEGASIGSREDVEGAAVKERGLTIWRLRADAAPVDPLRTAGEARAWPVFRDGSRGDGPLRALTGRVVVQWDPQVSDTERGRLERRHGLVPDEVLTLGRTWRLYRLAAGVSPLDAAAGLLDVDGVLHVAPDWWRERVPY